MILGQIYLELVLEKVKFILIRLCIGYLQLLNKKKDPPQSLWRGPRLSILWQDIEYNKESIQNSRKLSEFLDRNLSFGTFVSANQAKVWNKKYKFI